MKDCSSSNIQNVKNIQLANFVHSDELLTPIKVEVEGTDEKNVATNELETGMVWDSEIDNNKNEDQSDASEVKEFFEVKTRRSQRVKRSKRSTTSRKKRRQVTDSEDTVDDISVEDKSNIFGQGKWKIEAVNPPPEKLKYYCTICENGITWSEKEPFVKHFEDNHFAQIGKKWELTCNKCNKGFKRSGTKTPFSSMLIPFIHHQMEKHNMKMPPYCKYYRCMEHDQCTFTSVLSGSIYQHIRCLDKETGLSRIPQNKTVCDICGREMLVGSLKTHLQTCNVALEDRRKFECNVCKMKFAAKHCLEAHVARKHDHTKSYICTRCAAQFFLKNDLVRHMWVHHKVSSLCVQMLSSIWDISSSFK